LNSTRNKKWGEGTGERGRGRESDFVQNFEFLGVSCKNRGEGEGGTLRLREKRFAQGGVSKLIGLKRGVFWGLWGVFLRLKGGFLALFWIISWVAA
jgi:hypothetical protein